MKIKYSINAEFDCVWLINGVFRESADIIEYPPLSALYLTVLPLNAILLPYTVKLVSGKAICNGELTDCYEVGEGYYAVRLKERHNYVYSPHSEQPAQGECGLIPLFWKTIKSGDIASARLLMSKELSDSVDDQSLLSFFAPYSDIILNRFKELEGDYFLINKDTGKSEAFGFEIVGGKISDIQSI